MKLQKNLQGTNRGGDEAKNQINNLEHKEAAELRRQRNMAQMKKQGEKKLNQNSKKKKEFKKTQRYAKEPLR